MRVLAVVLPLAVPSTTHAEPVGRLPNILYLEAASLMLTASASLDYDRALDAHFGIRVGFGASAKMARGGIDPEWDSAYGGHVLATFVAGRRIIFFEADLGVAVVSSEKQPWLGVAFADEAYLAPNAFVGARLSPPRAGIMCRAGATLTGAWGLGMSAAIGVTF